MSKIYTVQQDQLSINTKLPANQQDYGKESSSSQIDDNKIGIIEQEFKTSFGEIHQAI